MFYAVYPLSSVMRPDYLTPNDVRRVRGLLRRLACDKVIEEEQLQDAEYHYDFDYYQQPQFSSDGH